MVSFHFFVLALFSSILIKNVFSAQPSFCATTNMKYCSDDPKVPPGEQDNKPNKSDNCNNNHDQEEERCNIYLAPSSIHGAGIGVYVTRSFKKGEVILSSDYGNTIPIIDPYIHPHHRKWTKLFNNYIWAQPTGASDELKYEAKRVVDLQLGLGCFPNSHSLLHNLGFQYDDILWTSGGDRRRTSGAGAYSYHRGRAFVAIRDIQEGEELFLNYGDQFLDSRIGLSHVPRKSDFLYASRMIRSIKQDIDEVLGSFPLLQEFNNTAGAVVEKMKDLTVGAWIFCCKLTKIYLSNSSLTFVQLYLSSH